MLTRSLCFLAVLTLTAGCATLPEPKKSTAAPPAFIENDFAKALAQAKEKKVPLFVDAWAMWCHTCRSMNAFVFTDKALAPLNERYVWLKIDTERAENAAFVERYPVEAWPTLFVIDPEDERVALRWLGSATVGQLEALLEDGARVIAAKKSGDTTGPERRLVEADQLYGEGKTAAAISAYRKALDEAPSRWNRRGRIVESLLTALSTTGRHEECARVSLDEGKALPHSPSFANVLTLGLQCALQVPADTEGRADLLVALEGRVRELMAGAPTGISADDVSSLYQVRMMAREARGDVTGMRALAEEWLGFLERQASRARSAQDRTVFDSHLVAAALALGKPERAIPALERSEKELASDYNPPARLAMLYLAQGKLDEALAANDRALEKVYGARKLKVFVDRSDILEKKGDRAGAVQALESARVFATSLPPSQQPKRVLEQIEKRVAALKASTAAATER